MYGTMGSIPSDHSIICIKRHAHIGTGTMAGTMDLLKSMKYTAHKISAAILGGVTGLLISISADNWWILLSTAWLSLIIIKAYDDKEKA